MSGYNASSAARARAARDGLSAAGLWVLIEFAVRDIAGEGLLRLLRLFGWMKDPGDAFRLDAVMLWPAMLMLAFVFYRRIGRDRLNLRDLGYRSWRSSIVIGLAASVVQVGLYAAAAHIDTALFGVSTVERFREAARRAGAWTAVVVLPANGVLGPVIEELAWRGYIQTRLIQGWGPVRGIAAASFLFALKHIIVDRSAFRTASLLAGGLAKGVVAFYWGTSASTVMHVLLNFLTTGSFYLELFHQ